MITRVNNAMRDAVSWFALVVAGIIGGVSALLAVLLFFATAVALVVPTALFLLSTRET